MSLFRLHFVVKRKQCSFELALMKPDLTHGLPLFCVPIGCCLSCFLQPLSCTRQWQQTGSSGPKCPTSSPSVDYLATTAQTSWTRSMSFCRPRVHSGATTTASTVALMMPMEGGVSDIGDPLLTVPEDFLWSNKRLCIPFQRPRKERSLCCRSLRCLAGHADTPDNVSYK